MYKHDQFFPETKKAQLGTNMYRFVVAVCCLAPAPTLARTDCKLGTPLVADNSSYGYGSTPLEASMKTSKAFDFLKSCDYGFVEKFVGKNHAKPTKMNPILKTLRMHSPMDWEVLSEGTVTRDLNSEETREDLESCISSCNRFDEAADWVDNSYEELLEDFVQKDFGSSKPDYACPKCVRYLPASLLKDVPDVLWDLKPKREPTTGWIC